MYGISLKPVVQVQAQGGGDGGYHHVQVGGLDRDRREMEPNGKGVGKEHLDGGRRDQEVVGTGQQGDVHQAGDPTQGGGDSQVIH